MKPSGSPPDWSGLTDAGDGTQAAEPLARAAAPISDSSRREPARRTRKPSTARATRPGPRSKQRGSEGGGSAGGPRVVREETPAWVLEATQGLEPPDWFAAAAAQSASSEPADHASGAVPSASSSEAGGWGVPAEPDPQNPFAAGAGRRGRKRTAAGSEDAPDAEMTPEEAESKARAIILRQLSMVARTRQQLAEKLAAGGVPQDTAETLLDRFEELGLIDDREFAMMWVRTRSATRRLAGSALRRELLQRGVDPGYIAEALEQLSDDDQRAAARELVDKKLRVRRPAEPRDKTVRRLVSMLARKGYGGGLAYGVVNEALADAGEHDDVDEFDTLDG